MGLLAFWAIRAFNSSMWAWKALNCAWVALLEATTRIRALSSGSEAARVANICMTGSGLGLGGGC